MKQPELALSLQETSLDTKKKARKPPGQRTLKIETVGDFAYCKIKPRIRLTGHWFEQAGFKPGHRVEIHLLKPGEMPLQFKEKPPRLTDCQPMLLGQSSPVGWFMLVTDSPQAYPFSLMTEFSHRLSLEPSRRRQP
jgi:hypothetical protein